MVYFQNLIYGSGHALGGASKKREGRPPERKKVLSSFHSFIMLLTFVNRAIIFRVVKLNKYVEERGEGKVQFLKLNEVQGN